MNNKFKWDMFVTSFLPLWISIIITSLWSIVIKWNCLKKIKGINLNQHIRLLISSQKIELSLVIVILCMLIISLISINTFINRQENIYPKPIGIIKSGRRANKLSSEFLLAYILPMIAFDYSNLKDIVLFLVYFVVLAFLCIRNNNIYTNIYLEFKGYKMYTCDIECKIVEKNYIYEECLIISKMNLASKTNHPIRYFDFDNYIYIKLENEDTGKIVSGQ